MLVDLVVSIINHNNPELLRECLRSIYLHTRRISFEVWVVDNCTDQRLVFEMRSEFPCVRWIFNRTRLGFSANHNQVMRVARARYVCILNDDTAIHSGTFDRLVEYMDSQPDIGFVAPRLLNPDGSIQDSAFYTITLGYFALNMFLLPRRLSGWGRRWIHPAQFGNQPSTVDWLLGACILVRDSTLAKVGFLDDKLSPIANSEDMDWCLRALKVGEKIAYNPNAVITHIGGASVWAPEVARPMRVEMLRTCIAYMRKHFGSAWAQLMALLLVISLPWNACFLLLSALRRRRRSVNIQVEISAAWAIARLGLRALKGGASVA